MRLNKVLTYLPIIASAGVLCTSCNSKKLSLTNYLAPNQQASAIEGGDANREQSKPPTQAATSPAQGIKPGATQIASAGIKLHPDAPSMVGSNLLVRTTAYCHKEADSLQYGLKNAEGGTLKFSATGLRSAAADWSRFPVGTRFKIHGEPQEYVIDDYGSALVGSNTIDLYKPTFGKMNEWGVRHVPIQIIEWGSFEKSREILDGRKHVKHADHVRKMLQDINSRYAIEQPASSSQPRA